MTDNRRGWWLQILTSIITSLAVLAGAWFTLQGDVSSSTAIAEASRLESAFKRIEYLESEMQKQQMTSNLKIAELTGQVFRLQAQLNKDLDIISLFESFMDGLPFEAWLKKVTYVDGEPKFTMLLINKKYEYSRGVSRIRYKGLTDSEIWGDDISKDFLNSDLRALLLKSSIIRFQEIPSQSGTTTNMVIKVYLELLEGMPMIFGMALETPLEK